MKPRSILKLEKELGIKLSFVEGIPKLNWSNRGCYLLNKNNQVIGLNLWNSRIKNISFLKDFKQLIFLDMNSNQITDISFLKDLKKLTFLNLGYNKITDASILEYLPELTNLTIDNNQITEVSFLNYLKKIAILDLNNNKIEDFSILESLNLITSLDIGNNKIIEITFLKNLVTLIYLYLNSNMIVDISPLKGLSNLEVLDLSNNQIVDISELKNLKKLNSLYLQTNRITRVPTLNGLKKVVFFKLSNNQIEEVSSLKNLSKLSHLNLKYNKINNIDFLKDSKQLITLKLSYNEVSDIKFLKDFNQLTFLDLNNNKISDISPLIKLDCFHKASFDENPIEYPPKSILKLRKNQIRQWLDEIEKYDEEPLYEAKLLIVGEPEAGKTSLRKKLIDPNYKLENSLIKETIGVYVHNGYMFPYFKDNSKTITSHIWDFGGQEKQYPLHQYFLKDKSVYALLSLDRGDNQYLDRWFSIIRLLSGNENEIILVLNQKHRMSQSSNFNKAKYERQGFKFKEYILDLSKDEERFSELQTDIQTALANLPHIGEMYPKYCKTIAEVIDIKRFEENKDYLTYEEYEKICNNLNLKDDDVPKKALIYLNIIGKVIHYEDDLNLERIIIINPHWLIDAIYGILTSEILDEFHQKGRFTKDWMINYLKAPTPNRPKGYKESESLHILNLMLKNHFDICYSVGNEFLIPLCMSEILPGNDFDDKEGIQSIFKYEVMPRGMVARVLVRLNEYIEKDLISRTSGILNSGINRAKIEEFYLPNDANKYIRIIVTGSVKKRKEFLDLIKKELIRVQKDWFENLEINELIPCVCSECVVNSIPNLFEMKELQIAINKGKFTKECKISTEDVNIFKLLGEVYEFNYNRKIESFNDIKLLMDETNYKDKNNIFFQFFGENQQINDILNMGVKFNISGDNPNSQFGGKNNTQNNYHNQYQDNKIVNEIKDILNDLKTSEQINEDWRKNFTDAYVEMSKLEEAEEKEVETKSISKLQKFFTKAKEIKDWVAIGVLPAEIATKGGKMIELGQELLKLFVK